MRFLITRSKMKLTLFLSTIFLAVALSTSTSHVKRSSIIENFKQSLYLQLNPIFQNTFQQLKELVDGLAKKISQSNKTRLTRADSSDWISDLFEGSGSITNQWNDQVNQFFQNITTVYENKDRSLFDNTVLSNKLHPAVKNLVQKLRKLFHMEIDRVIIQQFSKSKTGPMDLNQVLRDFQEQVSRIFDNTEERIQQTIDNFFQSISNYLNQLNDRFLG